MARTQAADYDDRREAILDRAAELFARQSFQGASVADLAKACGISKSLIYHYYPSKEDILHGVMASHVEALLEAVEDVGPAGADARTRLTALIARFMDLYVDAADRQKVLLNELDHLPPARRAEIVAKQRHVIAAIEGLLAEVQPALAGDRARLRAATMLVFGMLNWTKTWFRPSGALTAQQVGELATKIMLSGVEGL